ncbi:tRNA uridine 5-carboxymethylaminomethyl modification enzyme GidA [Pelomyxa schiedti]|nr:tRNA uridine 5-carboxymethylaminomethyl modification enzyme GidA [Pelomyxa schiedti]
MSKEATVVRQEKIAGVLAVIGVPTVVWFIWGAVKFGRRRAQFGSAPAQLEDFWMAVAAMLVIMGLRTALSVFVTRRAAERFVVKQPGWDENQLAERREKFQHCVFQCLFYTASTLFGWWTLVDKSWVPGIIVPGATGDVDNCWTNFFDQENNFLLVRLYYMISLGYSAQSLVYLILRKHRRDFLEMAIHHALHSGLIIYSFLHGYIRIGTLVLAVHDINDIFIASCRSLSEAGYKKAGFVSFFLLITSWVWFRLFLFPAYIIHNTMFVAYDLVQLAFQKNKSPIQNEGYALFNFMLCGLLVLHFFWFFMFLRMAYNMVNKLNCDDEINVPKNSQPTEQPETKKTN